MRTFKFTNSVLAALAFCAITACSDDDNPENGNGQGNDPKVTTVGDTSTSEGILFENGTTLGNGNQNFVFTGNETIKKGTYYLKGWIYIAEGAKLTIEPGTVIKGDKETKAALIVERGGQLFAEGTKDQPIVMTSEQPKGQRKPGDWGGLIICGKAKNNQNNDMQIEGGPRSHHGGRDDNDNSGILRYVRVEFAGYPFEKDKEINGITFGSVGKATQIDHLQVSYSNDDSYEWFGGTVDCKYLVAYRGWDDEFDTDNGFSGKVQFCLGIRDPRIADVSQSNGFESDNCADGATIDPYTTATFSNVTFIGPIGQEDGFVNNDSYINGGNYYPNNGSGLGKFQAAMQIRRSSHLACFNSVATGYPIGLIIDSEKGNTRDFAEQGKLKLQNIFFAGMTVVGSDANKVYGDSLLVKYENGKAVYDASQTSYSSTFFKNQKGNRIFKDIDELKLTGVSLTGVNFMPVSGSPLLGAASFTDAAVSSGFDKVSYIGAFSGESDNWLDGWTNFDPQNTDY